MDEKFNIEQKVVEMLKTVFDPEIPVNVYDLGLIYKIDVTDDFIIEDIHQKVNSIKEVKSTNVNIVFEPEWTKDMMSEEAKLDLGFI